MPHHERPEGWRGYLPRHPRIMGKRGQTLLLLGIMWVLEGLSLLGAEPSGVAVHHLLPTWVGVVGWTGTGLIALAAALRPPGIPDHWGFSALYLMPVIRLFSYFIGWVGSWRGIEMPPWIPVHSDGWRFVAIYAALTGIVMICAGWPEPVRARREDA